MSDRFTALRLSMGCGNSGITRRLLLHAHEYRTMRARRSGQAGHVQVSEVNRRLPTMGPLMPNSIIVGIPPPRTVRSTLRDRSDTPSRPANMREPNPETGDESATVRIDRENRVTLTMRGRFATDFSLGPSGIVQSVTRSRPDVFFPVCHHRRLRCPRTVGQLVADAGVRVD